MSPSAEPLHGASPRPGDRLCQVKICGVTSVADAELAVDLGADFVGLNFFPPSPRCLDLERARLIAEAVRGRAALVAVFVDLPDGALRELDEALRFDLLQFHGDEPPERLRPWGRRALKVFRVAPQADLVREARFGDFPEAAAFLFDIKDDRLYGGSGRSWSYGELARLDSDRPLFVAGGIRPGNARQAALASGADVLDVCSGVESAPGRKDPDHMTRLFQEVRHGQGPGAA